MEIIQVLAMEFPCSLAVKDSVLSLLWLWELLHAEGAAKKKKKIHIKILFRSSCCGSVGYETD